jgi:hypothetical protein
VNTFDDVIKVLQQSNRHVSIAGLLSNPLDNFFIDVNDSYISFYLLLYVSFSLEHFFSVFVSFVKPRSALAVTVMTVDSTICDFSSIASYQRVAFTLDQTTMCFLLAGQQ